MEDKELIELAAKAAGVTGTWHRSGFVAYSGWSGSVFDPLNDDGDALRLAVSMNLLYGKVLSRIVTENHEDGDDIYATTRRAITRAAAQIGKEMK